MIRSNGCRTVVAAFAAAVVIAAPVANSETRLALNGARTPGPPLNAVIGGGITPEEYDAYTVRIGENWFAGATPKPVEYPATAGLLWGPDAPTVDESAATGQANLHTAIVTANENGDPVVVAALSEGTIVADRELAHLATNPSAAPDAEDLTFVLMASPSRGVASLLAPGTYIPIVGYTTQPAPETQYDVDIVFVQYDGWADFPDRPWNLVSVANAVAGSEYLHTPTALVDPSEAVEVASTTNSQGGATTTYMVPTEQLPLTNRLREAGVSESVTDPINDVLRPVVDAGYSRNDAGNVTAREPYVSRGKLVVSKPMSETTNTKAAPRAKKLNVLKEKAKDALQKAMAKLPRVGRDKKPANLNRDETTSSDSNVTS